MKWSDYGYRCLEVIKHKLLLLVFDSHVINKLKVAYFMTNNLNHLPPNPQKQKLC